ncbi:MAG: AAA family ATPase [Planctomycetes bacterium]|nr:AAA family ATPase [Planctomycetota bacterium]
MSFTVHTRHRPAQLADVVGFRAQLSVLQRAINSPGFSGGALLITGPSGTGKSSIAESVVHALVKHASRRHVMHGDKCTELTVQKLADQLKPLPLFSGEAQPWAGVVIDEAHNMTPAALGAWLNALEHSPANVVYVFTSTESPPFKGLQNEIDAMISRCLHIELCVDSETQAAFVAHVRKVSELEGLGTPDVDATFQYLQRAKWNLRKALNDLPTGKLARMAGPTKSLLANALLDGRAAV